MEQTAVYFGNLTVQEFEKEVGVIFSNDDREWLESHRQDSANHIKKDKLHIYKHPLAIFCGKDIHNDIYTRFKDYDYKRQWMLIDEVEEVEE